MSHVSETTTAINFSSAAVLQSGDALLCYATKYARPRPRPTAIADGYVDCIVPVLSVGQILHDSWDEAKGGWEKGKCICDVHGSSLAGM